MRGSFTGAYVRRTGDTMTGALTIATDTTPGLIIDRPDGSDYRAMDVRRAGTMVWHFFETLAEPRLRIRDAGSAERVNIQTTDGKMLAGVVPLARMGTVVVDASSTVPANTNVSVTLEAAVNAHQFRAVTVRGDGTNAIYQGARVTELEAVLASFHTAHQRSSTGTDFLLLTNGGATSITATYKVYDLTET